MHLLGCGSGSNIQLLDGLDVLLINPLSPLQEQFVAQTILGMFTNLTADDFRRLVCHRA